MTEKKKFLVSGRFVIKEDDEVQNVAAEINATNPQDAESIALKGLNALSFSGEVVESDKIITDLKNGSVEQID